MTDPNGRDGNDDYECPSCASGGGNTGSNLGESFGTGPATGSDPTGPLQASIPIRSAEAIAPADFEFFPSFTTDPLTDTTDANGLRTIVTPGSRVEIEPIGDGATVRIYDGNPPSPTPTHIREYSRVTNIDMGPGLRVVVTDGSSVTTRDFFQSPVTSQSGTTTQAWKVITNGNRIREGITTSTAAGRTEIVSESVVHPGGNVEATSWEKRIYTNYAWGSGLVRSESGLGDDFEWKTYEYLQSPATLAGEVSYWQDSTGAWERYDYDPATRRLTKTLRPWLDTPANPADAIESNCDVTIHGIGSVVEQRKIKGSVIAVTPVNPSSQGAPTPGFWNDDNKTFTPLEGGDATQSTQYHGENVVPNDYARWISISDSLGIRRRELQVFTGGVAWATVTWTDYEYGNGGRLAEIWRDGVLISTTTYDDENGTRTVTGEDGSSVTYSSDDPESENSSQVWTGVGFTPITSSTSRDGNTSTYTRSAGVLTVTSSSTSSPGGRLLSQTDELGRTTNYTYGMNEAGQRTETETGPGGVTRVTTYHRDGQLHSITGTGVVPEFYKYSVEGGLIVTTVHYGTEGSPRWRKSFSDTNGMLKKEQTPLPGGRSITREFFYDGFGRMTHTTQTGLPTEVTEFDTQGKVVRRGLSIDGNATLDRGLSDRILERETFYVNDGGWWEVTVNYSYLGFGNDTKTEISRTRRRLGLGANSRTIVERADGSVIDTLTEVNRATGATTVTATANFSTQPARSKYLYGRLVEQGSFTVAAPIKYFYDALGRVQFIRDPRTGLETEIGLNAAGQQLRIERPDPDGAGPLGPLVTEFGYYPANHANAGELHWTEDGLGKRTYRAYNPRGQLTHQWGSGTYPLRHLYNAYGDMTGLHTWRAGDPAAWSTVDLPAAFNATAPDITTWIYDEGSGLLVQKQDHSGRGPTYLYHDSGLLQRRTWARGLFADYDWTAAGELESIDYSDTTPDVGRTYRRDGSLATVTDAAGTTTYGYNGTLASGESIQGGPSGPGLLDGLTLSYPQSAGRRQGFTASLGPDTLSAMGYGYDTYGRLESVTDPGFGANGFAAVFGYVPDSDLPFTTVSKSGDANGPTILTGTRGYDAADRLTSIGYTRPGNTVVTSHGYTLDAANRRTRADREDGTAWSYGYNDRDEVTSAIKLLPGEELLAGWQQSFDYDNLGNRLSSFEGGNATGANRRETVYSPNALNQYTSISHPEAFDVLGRAPSDVSVTVNEQPVTRQGEFWRAELGGLPNALAAVWQPVQVDAVDPGAGPNGADLPARRSGHRFVPMATETPYYDFDGNLVADARWNYVWNGENQLIEVTTAAPALAAGVPRERYRFVYDSRSRRIARTVERWDLDTGAWVVEKSERFVYDDWNVVAVVDAAGEVVQRYVWGNDLSGTPQGAGGVGGLLAAVDAASGRSWCYAYDGNGNVSAVVDLADGAKVGRYDYDAFGRTIATWGDEGLAWGNPYRFSTKPLEGTGLYYYGYRWYEAAAGTWLGRDPIGERGGVNLYAFVGNTGICGVDYLGREPVPVSGGFGFDGANNWFQHVARGGYEGDVGTGGTGENMLNYLKELTKSKENCCIKDLRLASHGGPDGLGGSGGTILQYTGFLADKQIAAQERADIQNAINPLQPEDPGYQLYTAMDFLTTGVRDVPDLQKLIDSGDVKFCPNCEIKIYACNQVRLPAALSAATRCKVTAVSGGKCGAKNPNVWNGNFYNFFPDGSSTPIGSSFNP